MKQVTITLYKSRLYDLINARTFKRMDAQLPEASQRTQNAVSSDTDENLDKGLIDSYLAKRFSELKMKLRNVLIAEAGSETITEFSNLPTASDTFEFKISVDDSMTADELQGLVDMMSEYEVRGALLDWYSEMGMDAGGDSEFALGELATDIASNFKGRPWGRRPMQPFAPAFYSYYKKNY